MIKSRKTFVIRFKNVDKIGDDLTCSYTIRTYCSYFYGNTTMELEGYRDYSDSNSDLFKYLEPFRFKFCPAGD